jgi:formate C-acetyltransferase
MALSVVDKVGEVPEVAPEVVPEEVPEVVPERPQDEFVAKLLESITTIAPIPRVERLRESFMTLRSTPSIDRARIETRVMKETEGEPMITRRAKVFAALAREIPIDIYTDELLVGYSNVKPRAISVSPTSGPGLEAMLAREASVTSLTNFAGYDTFDPSDFSEEEKRELREELIPYWKGNGNYEKSFSGHYGHNIIGYDKVIEKGFLGILRDAEERIARLDPADPQDLKKSDFLEGVAMAMQAAAELGNRFAVRARQRAEEEEDGDRKAELLRIAEVCDRVPAHPARTFHEAIQSCYFTWVLQLWEIPTAGGQSVGRVDQYLYPFYKSDMEAGRITKEQAQELIDCFLIKLNHAPPVAAVTVGGVKSNGQDASNEMSYMIIEGMMHTRLRQPFFSVQVHNNMPEALLIKGCQLSALGTGHPQFINSDVLIAQALARGILGGAPMTLQDARAGAPIGCIELGIPGKDSGYLYYGSTNLAAAMELVLTNGVRRSDGKKIGLATGDPRQFTTFEEVREAYRQQVAFMKRNTQIGGSKREQRLIDLAPTVYESALIDDCIEAGVCREEGGAHYNFNTGCVANGSTDAGDSLAAIKKLVFDDEQMTMGELCDALEADFEVDANVRNKLLEAPKFGNDDDYADEQVAWVVHQWASEFTKLKNLRGGYGCPGGSPMQAYVPLGNAVGALPSGRHAWQPLAEAASPGAGSDVNGPTAVLKSMGKVDAVEVLGGLILNMRIDPAIVRNGNVQRLTHLIRSFVDQKIYHVQINVISSDTLRAAQEEPEKYRDLMVKVAGYNAFFTQLSKQLQDSIIARTEHSV